MLNIVEKTIWCLAGFALVLLVSAFALLGIPSTTPLIAVTARKVDLKELNQGQSEEQVQRTQSLIDDANRRSTAGGTSKGGKRRGGVERDYRIVSPTMFDRVKTRSDALYEANQIMSEVVENEDGTNSLKVFDFDESNSALGRVGFKEDDIIDRVNGESIDFNSYTEASDLYEEMRDEMKTGGTLVFEVRRKSGLANRPQLIVLRLEDVTQ